MEEYIHELGWIKEIYRDVCFYLKNFTLPNNKICAVGVTSDKIMVFPVSVEKYPFGFFYSTNVTNVLEICQLHEVLKIKECISEGIFEKK